MRIAVYSGSFNPLHIGHLAIMKHLVRKCSYDGVYLVVSPQNPFKSAGNLRSADVRLSEAREAVARWPGLGIRVEDIEYSMEPPHYTVRTLDALSEREPQNSFTLVIGADNLLKFRGWRDYSKILLQYGVAVYPRRGCELESARKSLMEENPAYRIEILDAPVVDISSSEIRDMARDWIEPDGLLM